MNFLVDPAPEKTKAELEQEVFDKLWKDSTYPIPQLHEETGLPMSKLYAIRDKVREDTFKSTRGVELWTPDKTMQLKTLETHEALKKMSGGNNSKPIADLEPFVPLVGKGWVLKKLSPAKFRQAMAQATADFDAAIRDFDEQAQRVFSAPLRVIKKEEEEEPKGEGEG